MAVKKILSTDTLETGFRSKYNETVDEIIIGYEFPATAGQQPNGQVVRLKKFGGGFIDIQLNQFYYTKQQITQLLNGIIGSPYVGVWVEAEAATGAYTADTVVDYNGRFWKANANTTDVDIPGVSNKWDDFIKAKLPVFNESETYSQDDTIRILIGGLWYQFASQTDNNTTTPSVESGVFPWEQIPSAVYSGSFVSSTSYLENQAIVDGVNIYLRNSTAGSGGGDPQPSTDVSNTYWTLIGAYKGVWNGSYVGGYSENNVTIDGSNNVYLSNLNDNTDELDAGNTMQWDLIGYNIGNYLPKVSAIEPVTDGSYSVILPELIGQYVLQINRGTGTILRPTSGAPSNEEANFNPATGTITFNTPLGEGEKVWAVYQSISSPEVPTNANNVVQTYLDMLDIATGSTQKTIVVLTDEQRGGRKSVYLYVPGGGTFEIAANSID